MFAAQLVATCASVGIQVEKRFLFLFQRRDDQAQNGVLQSRIWQQPDAPELLQPYFDAIRALNRNGTLRYYPGSPLIARHLLREDDKLQLSFDFNC